MDFGRALIKALTFCFADEPTSALDWRRGEQVVEPIRAAATERGTTVLIVSHGSHVVPYAEQVWHIEDGYLTEPAEQEPAVVLN